MGFCSNLYMVGVSRRSSVTQACHRDQEEADILLPREKAEEAIMVDIRHR